MKKLQKSASLVLLSGAVLLSTAACGSAENSEDGVPVQSVAAICGMTDAMQIDQYAGVVTSGKEAQVQRQSERKIAEVLVSVGDTVTKDQVLFTYDAEEAQNDLDKKKLELEQLENTLTTKQAEKTQLEKDKAKAKQEEQLDYTLKIQEADTSISETNYNIGLKKKEIEKTETLLQNLEVRAPFEGKVESIASTDENSSYSYSDGSSSSDSGTSFIKIVQTDVVRVKGLLNEANLWSISTDMPMVIRSRIDSDQTWSGTVTQVDTGSADTSNNDSSMYYSDNSNNDEMTTSSNYAFYVTLDHSDDILIGQHVYIEPDYGQTEESDDRMDLPAGFILDADGEAYVWAEDANGKLTKKTVTLGAYSEEEDTYTILDGLTEEDYIAYPDDSYSEGMLCTETEYLIYDEDMESDWLEYDSDSMAEWFEDEEWSDVVEIWDEEVLVDEAEEGDIG